MYFPTCLPCHAMPCHAMPCHAVHACTRAMLCPCLHVHATCPAVPFTINTGVPTPCPCHGWARLHVLHDMLLHAFPPCPTHRPGYNPATWMLEVTGGSMSTTFKSSGHDFPTLYQVSWLELCCDGLRPPAVIRTDAAAAHHSAAANSRVHPTHHHLHTLPPPHHLQESELRRRNEAHMDELAAQGAKDHVPLRCARQAAPVHGC